MELDESEPSAPRAAIRRPRAGTVALEAAAPGIALVTLRGEHDLTTRSALSEALGRASEDDHILVDLSHCTFIDSSVIGALVHAFQALEGRGRRLELAIAPAARTIARTARIAGLTSFMAIHETRDAGLASLGREG